MAHDSFDPRPRRPEEALKESHEVPATKEAGSEAHLHSVGVEAAEKYLKEEESRITSAFNAASKRLEDLEANKLPNAFKSQS